MIISKGIKHMIWAGLFFSFMNLGVKLLPDLPVLEIVFFRALIMVVITLFLLKKHRINPLGNNKPLLILRGILGVSALSLYFYSLQNMPLASAVTIMQLSPIFTTLLAIVILKEKIKPIQLLFFLISFIGVIFIKGFDT
ncbi:MAG TPA: EamA family transporter, partial [Bacteroidetes bacterium]|nr:EamA family transporter [Bacteroidota bacterium]